MDYLLYDLGRNFKPPTVTIDNLAYRLHYRLTFVILMAFSSMVFYTEYFGEPIACISTTDFWPSEILEMFCWTHNTFSVQSAWNLSVGYSVTYPGVAKKTPKETLVYHTYYLYVCFVLFFQAVFFYAPHFMWKSQDNFRIDNLLKAFEAHPLDENRKKEVKKLAKYLEKYVHLEHTYFLFYFMTEIFNLVNVIGQMVIMDKFLNGQFSTYGWDVIDWFNLGWEEHTNPMIKVFPHMSKCTFYSFGPTKTVQTTDAMCLLPINILNEKIYLFLWFWFNLVAGVSMIAVVYRLLIFLIPSVRFMITLCRCPNLNRKDVIEVFGGASIGYWFIFDRLAKNISRMSIVMLINSIKEVRCNKTKPKTSESAPSTVKGSQSVCPMPLKEPTTN